MHLLAAFTKLFLAEILKRCVASAEVELLITNLLQVAPQSGNGVIDQLYIGTNFAQDFVVALNLSLARWLGVTHG
jgi:hypothetical protein